MTTQEKIKSVGQEIIDLLIEKNKSYGDSALKPANIFANGDAVENLSARIDDKLMRIKNKGFDGYEVSNQGNVKGKRVKILKPLIRGERGGRYLFVALYTRDEQGKLYRKCIDIHILVARAFLGPRPEGMVVHHKNGNRRDNRVSNLGYVSFAENVRMRLAWKN